MLAFDEIGNQVHRTGAIEGDDGDDVLKPVRPEAGEQVAHAGTFQLENPGGFAGRKELKGFHVVERELFHRERRLVRMCFVDENFRPVDHGQGLEPEEVEFDQADLFDIAHRVLRHDFVVGPLVEGHMVGQRAFGDDDAGRVRRGMPRQTFQRLRDFHQLGDSGVGVDQLHELRL